MSEMTARRMKKWLFTKLIETSKTRFGTKKLNVTTSPSARSTFITFWRFFHLNFEIFVDEENLLIFENHENIRNCTAKDEKVVANPS